MSLYFGATEITGLYFGDTEITGLYFGDTEIWAAWAEYDGTLPAQYSANGTTLTDYRIYGVNGGVGDRTEQLFDVETAVYKNGVFKNDSGIEAKSPGAGYYETYIPITPSETIYVINAHGSQNLTVRLYFYDAQKQWIQRTDGYAQDFSVVVPSNAAYAQLQISPAFIPSPNTITITQGSTTEYVPYGYEVPIGVSGNVHIDKNKGLYGYTINSYSNSITQNAGWWVSDYIPVVEGATYTGVNTGQDTLLYDKIGGMSTSVSGLRNGLTIPQGKRYMRMNVNLANMNSFTVSVQYPSNPIYIGSSPLNANGEYADYVDYQSQKIKRRIKTRIFDGSETFTPILQYAGVYTLPISDHINNDDSIAYSSNYYTWWQWISNGAQYGSAPDKSLFGFINLGLYVKDMDYLTSADFKNHVKELYDAGTPLTVTYVTREYYDTDPPVPLPALPTVDGTNIVDYAGQSTAVPSRFYAKYRKEGY